MSLNQFIDTGADSATVNYMKKSIAREEDLQKAMNRAGLVQKEVQVKGKNGQMFTRKQWVKASDAQASTGKQSANSKDDIDKKISVSTDDVSKKVDDLVKQYSKADYDIQAAKFNHDANAETRARSRRTEAQKKLKELGYKPQKSKDVKGLFTAQKIEDSATNQKSTKVDDKSSSGKFKPSDFQFRSGGQDVADFVNSIDKEFGVKKHTNGSVGFGTLSLENGASVNFGYDDTGAYATWNGSNFRDVKSLKSAMSGQKSDQGKMNHQTGIRDKKAPTMIEDYFAGNHSHDDGKKALAGLLGKGYSREDIMEQAEKSGVTWKKNDHAGINWMRASMAIQKHLMNTHNNNSEKTKSNETTKDSNKSTSNNSNNRSLKGELSFENQAVRISQLHDIGKLATYIGNGKNRKFDVKKANAALKTFADEFGITENGGKLEITETGFITATSADGVTKKFYKIKTPNESENFIISDRQIDSFLKARGQTFDESKINRISKERYGRRFYDIFHEKNG